MSAYPQGMDKQRLAIEPLLGLQEKIGKKKWWVNQLPIVLWAYYTTPHTALGETPYSVTYGQNCHIVEIGILKLQIH